MKKVKFLSIIAIVVFCMGFVSCNEEEPKPEVDEYGISLTQEVDLGLPNGTIWAGWNIGASSPEQYGGYYAWGEIEEKDDYTLANYSHYSDLDGEWKVDYDTEYDALGYNISGTQYDVARHKWGGEWRMPTREELNELIDNCTFTWIEYKGVKGCKVTGPNGKSIFFPAAGTKSNGYDYHKATSAYYMSGTCDIDVEYSNKQRLWHLTVTENLHQVSYSVVKYFGSPVRPVK